MPHCCIGVDVIVGFPGETDEDFKETYKFIQELDISYLHVFTYSERANTPAADMDNVVPVHIRRERNEMLRILSEKKRRHFYEQYENTQQVALLEGKNIDGKMTGSTENYIKIAVDYDEALINQLIPVQLDKLTHREDELMLDATIL